MAKATTKKNGGKKASAKKTVTKKPDMFARAKKTDVAKTTTKTKGTVFALPKDLDEDGALRGTSKNQNEAITTVIGAKGEEKTAVSKGKLAKGILNPWTLTRWCTEYARLGVMPPTPVSVVNHVGETLTYVVQDKTQQNTLNDEQVELLEGLLGEDAATVAVEEATVYGFNKDTMAEPAGDVTVEDVVFELVSEVLMNDPRLSDDQKASLIDSDTVKRLRPGMLGRLAEITGADATKIEQVIEAIGSGSPHYLKP